MAVKSRRSYKGAAVSNTLGSQLLVGGTTISLAATMSGWPTSSEPFFCVIDPGTAKEEKVCVVYATTTTLTVVDPADFTSPWGASANGRGVDNTTAYQHEAGAVIYPCITARDIDEANELVSKYGAQGSVVYQGASTFTELAVGTAGQVLKVNSGATAPEWGQVATAGIADSAVTSAKIADATIVAGDIASATLKLLCPVGSISPYAGASAPTGWLLCDGTAISGSYTELIALVGANTPDMRGRFLYGKTAAGTGSTLLGTGGSTTIAEANLPSHAHTLASHTHTINHDHEAGGSHSHTITISDPGHVHNYDEFSAFSNLVVNPADSALSTGQMPLSQATTRETTGITATASSSNVDLGNFTGNSGGPSTANTGSTGSGTAYLQPFTAINYIIKHDY